MVMSSLQRGQLSGQGLSPFDVTALSALIAAAKQNNEKFAADDEIDSISRAEVDLEFNHSCADVSCLSGISLFKPVNSMKDLRPAPTVSQVLQPLCEFSRAADKLRSHCFSSQIVTRKLHRFKLGAREASPRSLARTVVTHGSGLFSETGRPARIYTYMGWAIDRDGTWPSVGAAPGRFLRH